VTSWRVPPSAAAARHIDTLMFRGFDAPNSGVLGLA